LKTRFSPQWASDRSVPAVLTRADYAEEQNNEMEALRAIYFEEELEGFLSALADDAETRAQTLARIRSLFASISAPPKTTSVFC
jgi:hypothetical protein